MSEIFSHIITVITWCNTNIYIKLSHFLSKRKNMREKGDVFHWSTQSIIFFEHIQLPKQITVYSDCVKKKPFSYRFFPLSLFSFSPTFSTFLLITNSSNIGEISIVLLLSTSTLLDIIHSIQSKIL